MTTHRL